MAELRPFKGIRYNQEISGDLSKNICPPFDSISPSLQKNLYEISPLCLKYSKTISFIERLLDGPRPKGIIQKVHL